MTIVSVTSVGKNKYVITNDKDEFICLYYREMKAFGMKADTEISDDVWQKARKEVITRGKKRLFHLLSRKDYTEHELRTKLSKTHYDVISMDQVLAYFNELGYVDDRNFAKKMYNYYKKEKSLRWIEHKLQQKGIDRYLIKESLEEVQGDEDNLKAACNAASKKIRRKDLTFEEQNKVIQSLARRGFDYATAKSAVDKIINEESDPEL